MRRCDVVGMHCRTESDFAKVERKAREGTFQSLGHAGGYIRKVARHSIKRSPKPSAPGRPPHTRRGAIKAAMRYAVAEDRQSVVIGPDVSVIGDSGKAHEFGGRYRRERYPKRAFMGPALNEARDKLPPMWAGSVR
jgi:hypothetical protein